MNESLFVRMLQKSFTKLAVFALVGTMMIFLVPMISEKAYAETVGYVQVWNIFSNDKFSNVKGILDAGKWRQTPHIIGNGWGIEWVTTGSGFFGGDEKGRILANLGTNKHVTLHWSNPSSGANTCSAQWNGPINSIQCEISQGSFATLRYIVNVNN